MSRTSRPSDPTGELGVRGLLVGRFQPFHLGHLGVVRSIRSAHPGRSLLLGIGSAQASFTPDNPFTAGERFEMIERALEEAGIDGCAPVPLTDIDRHALWVSHVVSLLPPFETVYTNNPLTRSLFERAGHTVESPPWVDRARFEGAKVRSTMLQGDRWRKLVPRAVASYLDELHAPDRMRLLSEGHPRRAKAVAR
jgi:nicotinamide-nucleotide adenylyltransferase